MKKSSFKMTWNKMPSVIRPNKFFYTITRDSVKYTVSEYFSGGWRIQTQNYSFPETFSTAKKAMNFAEKCIKEKYLLTKPNNPWHRL